MIKSYLYLFMLICFCGWIGIACAETTADLEIASTATITMAVGTATPAALVEMPIISITEADTFVCADLDGVWGVDWEQTVAGLLLLQSLGADCGYSIEEKLYAAYFSYGAQLEAEGNTAQGIGMYRAALQLDGVRVEALQALSRLQALPVPTPAPCYPELAEPLYVPNGRFERDDFVQVLDQQLILDGRPFLIRGVNYYPRHAPWHLFLTEMNEADVAQELDLIAGAGFNTVRIFLWYDPLFTCEPELAVPNEMMFGRVDAVLDMAADRGLKVIVTLHDLPDLLFRPVYTDWSRYEAQTRYIVTRYQANPTILAWDLRNEGDLDDGARGDEAQFTEQEVMGWLADMNALVREVDDNHLLTAGWWGDPTLTEPYVDFLSFHHWSDVEQLQDRIEVYQQGATKPILLEEIGYHSWADGPLDQRDEATQAMLLKDALQTAEANELAGWVIWTAFDFAPDGQPDHFENHFGLWRQDLTPKEAIGVLQQE